MFRVTEAYIIDPYLVADLLPCFTESDRETVAKSILRGDESYSIWDDKEIVGVMGGTMANGHSMYAWAFFGQGIKRHPLTLAKKMKQFMEECFEVKKVKRFFVTIDQDNEVAIRQNKWMGLSHEGLLRKAGSRGQDQVLMAKVVE